MLTIRMQRRGRSGHAQFRVVVQDSRFHPSSGRVVAYVGNYDPHAKTANLDGQKISDYLEKGAQPSDRVVKLLTKEGIKLPDWVKVSEPKKKAVRNPDKRRSTRPEGAPAPEPKAEAPAEGETEASAEQVSTEEAPAAEAPAKEQATEEAPAEEAPEPAAEEKAAEKSAEDTQAEPEAETKPEK